MSGQRTSQKVSSPQDRAGTWRQIVGDPAGTLSHDLRGCKLQVFLEDATNRTGGL